LNDTYYTIDHVFEATFKDKGSKFLAYANPIKTTEEAKVILEKYRKDARFKGACHFCYAYKLGNDNNNFRSSDDGEPAGTAGKPILNQIESFKLSDLIVIVVRFFGGTLLGTSGLIQAYKQAAIN
jgi:putative IMPACT (imprinted ancient) family translation regulator